MGDDVNFVCLYIDAASQSNHSNFPRSFRCSVRRYSDPSKPHLQNPHLNYYNATTRNSISRTSPTSPSTTRKSSPTVIMPRQGRSGGGSRPSRGGSRPMVPASKPAPVQSRPATTSAMPSQNRAGPPAAPGQTSGVPAVQQPQTGGGGGMMSNIISTGM